MAGKDVNFPDAAADVHAQIDVGAFTYIDFAVYLAIDVDTGHPRAAVGWRLSVHARRRRQGHHGQ